MRNWANLLALLVSAGAWAELPPVAVSNVGCAMAHCNAQMLDQTNLPAPVEGAILDFPKDSGGTQRNDGGSTVGLGCSSNGVDRFACSYASASDALIVYDRDANFVWKSGTLLNLFASGSAPLIDRSGIVFGADSQKLIRVNTVTNDVRKVAFPNRVLPISPIPVADGGLFIASKSLGSAPPFMLVDTRTMTLTATRVLRLDALDGGYFETANTPTSSPDGRRVYVLTKYVSADGQASRIGRLYAIDIDAGNANPARRLIPVWFYEFVSPSGASPTYVDGKIFFDGQLSGPLGEQTYIMAVKDNGISGTLAWKRLLRSNVQASFAIDPRGGLWVYPFATPDLLRLSLADGSTLQMINVDNLLNVSGVSVPSSALTIHGDANDPVLVLGAADRQSLNITETMAADMSAFDAYQLAKAVSSPTYVMAINLRPTAGSLRSAAKLSNTIATLAAGQFPAIPRNGKTAVVFSTLGVGPYLLTAP